MDSELLAEIYQQNPWLRDSKAKILVEPDFIERIQLPELLESEWDSYWIVLIGPRRAGKTTLGKFLAKQLVDQGKFGPLLYLNCDFPLIRSWLASPTFLMEALEVLELQNPILFIDEVQRLESPGLLLKAVIDLGLPLKYIATGSSQLELKSKVSEFLTGRQLSSVILPLSCLERPKKVSLDDVLTYGCYPQVIKSSRKELQLTEIYNRYVQKDIVEILKVGKPDVLQRLMVLMAHGSGQLVNYNQLATDCKVSSTMIRNHLDILEQTFVLEKVTPFVGNKRTEVTSNPVYYYLDNGFRNVALRNFSALDGRTDLGLLVESLVFQEIYKFRAQHYLSFDIHYWRTKSGAEVDFVVSKNSEQFAAIEVKYRRLNKPAVTRGFRSFLQAYQPPLAVVMTKNYLGSLEVEGCNVQFIPVDDLPRLLRLLQGLFA